MNVFVISPGRTATTTFSEAFASLPGYTSLHESRVTELGDRRILYPNNHIECDNRLVWFLCRLTRKYGEHSILVVLKRDKEKIALSYNNRWRKILIMKAFSQGILMRGFRSNNLDVCREYVEYCYEQIDFYSKYWNRVIYIDVDNPENGISELLETVGLTSHRTSIVEYVKNTRSNTNVGGIKSRIEALKYNFLCLLWDLK
jgi:hypothetical protein